MSIFSEVKAHYARTSLFNLSHEVKNTMKFGQLVPFLCQEILPGDIWRVRTEILTRLQAMKAPIMHNVNVYTHFFFVPNRLVWKDWEEFVTQALNGTFKGDINELPLFHLTNDAIDTGLIGPGSLFDHLGAKFDASNAPSDIYVNALPVLAYNKIWNDFYRDENLDTEIGDEFFELPSGPTVVDGSGQSGIENLLKIRYRAFAKDYFTSALPWTQKGDAAILPLGGSAPVDFSGVSINGINLAHTHNTPNVDVGFTMDSAGNVDNPLYVRKGPGSLLLTSAYNDTTASQEDVDVRAQGGLTSSSLGSYQPVLSGNGSADLSGATAVTINELRRANALQRWLEANARGGSRYIEMLKSHFGVVSDDARLQRAEYLGGGKSPIIISEVLQQSASTIDGSDTPQGNMAGHGIGTSVNHSFKRRFKEHGYLIGIMSVMPRSNYMQGVPRHFLKRDVFDFGWPLLANLGEQPIYDAELYSPSGVPESTSDMGTFGYTPRYAEYKFMNDQVSGDFRTSLDFWHLAREFGNKPSLNSKFISSNSLSPRIFPSASTDYILNQMYLDCKVVRKLPKFGTPML